MKKPINTELEAKRNPAAQLAESMVFGGPGSIERQEKNGQGSFVSSDTLPSECRERNVLEAAGVTFLGPVEDDPLFVYVVLPDGWKKVPSDHAMWSHLVDDKGRERAAIFYKAAFYDRGAHMSPTCRYSAVTDYDAREKGISAAHAMDGKTPIFTTTSREEAQGWLDSNFPDWKNSGAYWD